MEGLMDSVKEINKHAHSITITKSRDVQIYIQIFLMLHCIFATTHNFYCVRCAGVICLLFLIGSDSCVVK